MPKLPLKLVHPALSWVMVQLLGNGTPTNTR